MRTVFVRLSLVVSFLGVAAVLCGGSSTQNVAFELFVIDKAHAEDGGEGGSGFDPKTVEHISRSSFLNLNRSQLYRLDLRNARVDTSIIIEGFGPRTSNRLIVAAARNRRLVRTFLRKLSKAKTLKQRDAVVADALKRAEARDTLLRADEIRTYNQIQEELKRLDELEQSGSPRLTALQQTFDEQQARRMRGEAVLRLFENWVFYELPLR